MLFTWLETIKKIPRIPAGIEKRLVTSARSSLKYSAETVTENTFQTIWVDISVICRHDAGTGIQRVVRALFNELQLAPPQGWVVRPIAATKRQPYYAVTWSPGSNHIEMQDEVDPQCGDIFLGLDLSAHIIPHHHQVLAQWKSKGVKFSFIIYDLLPLQYHQWFSAKLVRAFRRWARSVTILADDVFCISTSVEKDFTHLLQNRFGLKQIDIATHVIPLGADIKASKPTMGVPEGFSSLLQKLGQNKIALMVGTIEPRKGHAQVLGTFEQMWANGNDINLVIIGRPGWMTQKLQQRINKSRYLNTRLFWFNDATDEVLDALYRKCTGVIIASYAEGFGLPLLEALGYGKPVLARNLEVFKQFKTPQVNFFDSSCDQASLAKSINLWIQNTPSTSDKEKKNVDIKLTTWRDSLDSLLDNLLTRDQPRQIFLR